MTLFDSFKNMPIILKFLTMHAIACFMFFLLAVIPGVPFTFNGQEMTFSELWSSGLGFLAILVGISMPIGGYLLLTRKPYSRLLYLLALSTGLVVPYLFIRDYQMAIVGVISGVLIAGYLYYMPSSKAFFSLAESSH